MSDYRRSLPPMGALVIFEAAARRLSFTRAAEEIGITQAAVSRQIQALEAGFGFALFRRKYRGIELTDPGAVLARAMSGALGQISEAVGEISDRTRPDQIVVAASVAFSHFWLLPRISDFRRAHPEVRLRVVAQDGQIDLAQDGVDLAVRYGGGGWKDGKVARLFTDVVYPVCSPDYIARHGRPDCVADLAQHGLISAHPQELEWLDWDRWIGAFGLPGAPAQIALTCNFYTDAVQAALAGEGIALGWHRLIDTLVQRGQLLRVTQELWQTHDGYHLVMNRDSLRRASVRSFLDWIRATAAQLTPVMGATPFQHNS